MDEITERLNQAMSGLENSRPDDLFRAVIQQLDPDNPNAGSGLFLNSSQAPRDEDSSEADSGDDPDRQPLRGELLPASIGGDSDRPAERQREDRSETGRNRRDVKRKFLDMYGSNLTRRAAEGKIDRVIGRQKELERVVQILNRRNKNNPVLLGEPGVGKTAIAEGLAVRIAEGAVPAKLLDQEVYLLDMTALVAGTQFRGQFESRMKGVVDEARKAGNIILVIDELHNIMGAGDAEGAMNAANILKPALAKGEIRVVGSTTLDEYRRFIEKDSALERRFQKVIVDEPSAADSIEILKGIRDYYEKHHNVTYSDETIAFAVKMADRYITDRFLPDKAIDLLDEAGSRVNLQDERLVHLERLNTELDGLEAQQQEQNDSKTDRDPGDVTFFEKQAEIKSGILRVQEEIDRIRSELDPTPIQESDIARVVEMWTGIPVQRITETETDLLVHLEERLHKRLIGQNEAVSAVSRAIRRNRAGFGKKRKPASFIFVGPTGVGKTELVKALAEAMFSSEDAMVRLDMSEFMEPHTVSKLIGSPPGYVGYDDGGQLTEKVRRKPYSVILLDEIEKAHADVFNILLQILDDGRLTDSHGRLVSFENTVIIMTSNAGTTLKSNGFGFGAEGHVAMENRVHTVLKEMFRPEFLNRVDEIIVFHELTREEIRRIVNLMLQEVETSMCDKGLKLVFDEAVKDALADKGYDIKYGARPLRKTIQRMIEDPLADLYLSGRLEGAIGVAAVWREGAVQFDTL
ncbi:MAG TPA: ATP-dependent Clp protease ATP-binding subunit [Clostridia bacterium]